MELSVAIASKNALPSAFVVWRGFEESIRKASEYGYHGVELALKSADEITPSLLSKWLTAENMKVSCISTGQVYADTGLMFSDRDPDKREKVIRIFRELIDLAADYSPVSYTHLRAHET